MALSLTPIDPRPVKEKHPKDSLVVRSCDKEIIEPVLKQTPDEYRLEYIGLLKHHLATKLGDEMRKLLEERLDFVCNKGDLFIEEQKKIYDITAEVKP